MNNKLFKKFIEFGIGNLIVLITGFISSPIITRLILPEEFGKFSMFNTLTSLLIMIGYATIGAIIYIYINCKNGLIYDIFGKDIFNKILNKLHIRKEK